MPPTSDALAGVRAKIDWAHQHLKQFDGLNERISDVNRDMVLHKDDTNTGQRSYYLARDPIIPVEYALLAGDVLQSLRCALDHLAFALCAAGPGGIGAITDNARKAIQFPITSGSADAYKAHRGRSVIVALAKPGVAHALDATEPYKGGAGELLVQLGVLNNIDKHRLLMTIALQVPALDVGHHLHALLREAFPDVASGFPDGAFSAFLKPANQSVLKAGDILTSEPIDSNPNKKVTFKFPIALNEPEILPVQPVVEALQNMTDAVSGLVPKFKAFV